jgi:heat shock protein HtpX
MAALRVSILFGFLTAIVLAIGYFFGGITGMIIGLLMALLINFMSYWYSDKFVLAMYGAKKINPNDYPDIESSLEKISKKEGIPKPPLYMINLPVPNAFATGRSPKKAAVAITKGLLSNLNTDEIEGVLAHEISHIKNRDTLIQTMAATLAGALTWLSYIFIYGDERNRNALSYIILFVLAPLAALLIRMAISRNREFLADKTGALASNPLDLASALGKIDKIAKHNPIRGNESTSHLFIVNPFSAGGIAKLFSTHPPIEERIARLRQMAV